MLCQSFKNESVQLQNKRNSNLDVYGVRSLSVSSKKRMETLWICFNANDIIYLRFNDIDLATKSKSALEHRQREEARIRKEANEKWETKVSSLYKASSYYPNSLRSILKISGACYYYWIG